MLNIRGRCAHLLWLNSNVAPTRNSRRSDSHRQVFCNEEKRERALLPARDRLATSLPDEPAQRINFVSYVACQWCAVGLHSLEKASQTVTGETPVELHFQPLELNQTMPSAGADSPEYLKAKRDMGDEQLARNRANIRERDAAAGFDCGGPVGF